MDCKQSTIGIPNIFSFPALFEEGILKSNYMLGSIFYSYNFHEKGRAFIPLIFLENLKN